MNTAVSSRDGLHDSESAAISKLESRWKSAVKKVSLQTSATELPMSLEGSHADKEPDINPPQPVHMPWHPVRSSQLRKVDSHLAAQQQAWLAPPICGDFVLNDAKVEWQLSVQKAVANPLTLLIGSTPMQVDKHKEHEHKEYNDVVPAGMEIESTGVSLTLGADSFLLNWIPVPWASLHADAKHALVLTALQPLVESLGLALGHHWHIAGIDQSASKANVPNKLDAARVAIGVRFRKSQVPYGEAAVLSVPQAWFEQFRSDRDAARQAKPFSIADIVAQHPQLGNVAVSLPVVVSELPLDVKSVRDLGVGDVIFFAAWQGDLANWWRSPELTPRLDTPMGRIDLSFDNTSGNTSRAVRVNGISCESTMVNGSRDCIVGSRFLSTQQHPNHNMENSASVINASGARETTTSDHIAVLPVAVTIEVAEFSLPLSALADIRPGTTLALNKPLNEHLLTVRANGLPVAFGELVMLDNEVGVRIKRLATVAPAASDIPRAGVASSAVEESDVSVSS
jgi:flagellar motor switch/type III secretory pathway protein FliN